jgi:hypothetical protein
VQILATEHWSLLSHRSLTYTESLARVNIFLAILSGAVVALALIAQVDHFGRTFTVVAIPVLLVVLFTGLGTISRLTALNRDDYRWVLGMNRLRHGYLQLYPELEQYFITGFTDDLPGALRTLGIEPAASRQLGSVFRHLPNTLPGMLSTIVGAVAAALAALIGQALGLPFLAVALLALVGFLVTLGLLIVRGRRSFRSASPGLEPRFPTDSDQAPAISKERPS